MTVCYCEKIYFQAITHSRFVPFVPILTVGNNGVPHLNIPVQTITYEYNIQGGSGKINTRMPVLN